MPKEPKRDARSSPSLLELAANLPRIPEREGDREDLRARIAEGAREMGIPDELDPRILEYPRTDGYNVEILITKFFHLPETGGRIVELRATPLMNVQVWRVRVTWPASGLIAEFLCPPGTGGVVNLRNVGWKTSPRQVALIREALSSFLRKIGVDAGGRPPLVSERLQSLRIEDYQRIYKRQCHEYLNDLDREAPARRPNKAEFLERLVKHLKVHVGETAWNEHARLNGWDWKRDFLSIAPK